MPSPVSMGPSPMGPPASPAPCCSPQQRMILGFPATHCGYSLMSPIPTAAATRPFCLECAMRGTHVTFSTFHRLKSSSFKVLTLIHQKKLSPRISDHWDQQSFPSSPTGRCCKAGFPAAPKHAGSGQCFLREKHLAAPPPDTFPSVQNSQVHKAAFLGYSNMSLLHTPIFVKIMRSVFVCNCDCVDRQG